MNNNRGNNRRRGRGNNRQQGGGQQVNRIDSRARGNAPQLLEKYRKLAHDAHLNGDRVTEEYYLQFADHYFRVLADSRQRQEEARARREERWQEGGDGYRDDSYRDGAEDGEFGEGDESGYEPHSQTAPRHERPRYDDRDDRGGRAPRAAAQNDQPEPAEAEAAEQRAPFEPVENPFTRDARSGRAPRARRDDRRPRREPRDETAGGDGDDSAPGFDPAVLPPAIAPTRVEEAAPVEVAQEAPKPRKRAPRKPKPPADEALTSAAGSE